MEWKVKTHNNTYGFIGHNAMHCQNIKYVFTYDYKTNFITIKTDNFFVLFVLSTKQRL